MSPPNNLRRLDRHNQPLGDAPAVAQLQGTMEAFSLIEVLEFLSYLRRTGTLTAASADGQRGTCSLADGQIIAAECAHRRGEEAALTMAGWRRGSFEFSTGLTSAGESVPLSVANMAMEAVRLEDELVRREAFLPAPTSALTLARDSYCPDPAACGIADLMIQIRARPGITLELLEAESSHCPTKVRLGVALLGHCRLLAAPSAAAEDPPQPDDRPQVSACNRLLIALEGTDLTSRLPRTLTSLTELLGAPSITPAASPESPTFARFRPAGAGVQSLIFLPISRENRLLFDSFARTVDFVLLDASSSAEGQRWREDLGTSPTLATLRSREDLEAQLKSVVSRWLSA